MKPMFIKVLEAVEDLYGPFRLELTTGHISENYRYQMVMWFEDGSSSDYSGDDLEDMFESLRSKVVLKYMHQREEIEQALEDLH